MRFTIMWNGTPVGVPRLRTLSLLICRFTPRGVRFPRRQNKLHWQLDVIFMEDASLKSAKHSAQNFSLLNRIALNQITACPVPGLDHEGASPKLDYAFIVSMNSTLGLCRPYDTWHLRHRLVKTLSPE